MGGVKQLALCETAEGKGPLVVAAFDAICPVCDDMVVVLGHEAERVAAALGERPFHRVEADADAAMFESVRAGLRAAQAIDAGATVVLQPGDHPEVGRETLETLVDWSLKRPLRAIIPVYGGSGGHPVLIPAPVAAVVIETRCEEGLGRFWSEHPELCERVEVADAAVVRDIDTVRDLEKR
jgi:molybdenum cofactor cytidylyltransferase